jgi:hypothetical protein
MTDNFTILDVDTTGHVSLDINIQGVDYNQDVGGMRVDTGAHLLADVAAYCGSYRTGLTPPPPPTLPADVQALINLPETF